MVEEAEFGPEASFQHQYFLRHERVFGRPFFVCILFFYFWVFGHQHPKFIHSKRIFHFRCSRVEPKKRSGAPFPFLLLILIFPFIHSPILIPHPLLHLSLDPLFPPHNTNDRERGGSHTETPAILTTVHVAALLLLGNRWDLTLLSILKENVIKE